MLLQDSPVAKQVRSVILDIVEGDCDRLKESILSLKVANDGAGSQEIWDWLEQYK